MKKLLILVSLVVLCTSSAISQTTTYHSAVGLRIGTGYADLFSASDYDGYSGIGLGLFPTGGADYKFGSIPLDVSVDIRPTFRVASPAYYNYDNFYFPDFGFSVRYTIN